MPDSPEHIEKLRRSLNEWVESAQSHDDDEDAVEVGTMVAFYPISEN